MSALHPRTPQFPTRCARPQQLAIRAARQPNPSSSPQEFSWDVSKMKCWKGAGSLISGHRCKNDTQMPESACGKECQKIRQQDQILSGTLAIAACGFFVILGDFWEFICTQRGYLAPTGYRPRSPDWRVTAGRIRGMELKPAGHLILSVRHRDNGAQTRHAQPRYGRTKPAAVHAAVISRCSSTSTNAAACSGRQPLSGKRRAIGCVVAIKRRQRPGNRNAGDRSISLMNVMPISASPRATHFGDFAAAAFLALELRLERCRQPKALEQSRQINRRRAADCRVRYRDRARRHQQCL